MGFNLVGQGRVGAMRELRRKDFDGHAAVEARVARAINSPIPPAPSGAITS